MKKNRFPISTLMAVMVIVLLISTIMPRIPLQRSDGGSSSFVDDMGFLFIIVMPALQIIVLMNLDSPRRARKFNRQQQMIDVSDGHYPIPEAGEVPALALREKGFEQLGAVYSQAIKEPAPPLMEDVRRLPSWCFQQVGEPELTAVININENPVYRANQPATQYCATTLNSIFEKGALVQTGYVHNWNGSPKSLTVNELDQSDIAVHLYQTNLNDVLERHQKTVLAFKERHGKALIVTDVDQWIEWWRIHDPEIAEKHIAAWSEKLAVRLMRYGSIYIGMVLLVAIAAGMMLAESSNTIMRWIGLASIPAIITHGFALSKVMVFHRPQKDQTN